LPRCGAGHNWIGGGEVGRGEGAFFAPVEVRIHQALRVEVAFAEEAFDQGDAVGHRHGGVQVFEREFLGCSGGEGGRQGATDREKEEAT